VPLRTAPAEAVWAALRDVGALHTRLLPGFVVDCRRDGDACEVTFANGMTARELIVDVSDAGLRNIGKTIHPHPTLGGSISMAAEVAHRRWVTRSVAGR
jgi:hypothetical protein